MEILKSLFFFFGFLSQVLGNLTLIYIIKTSDLLAVRLDPLTRSFACECVSELYASKWLPGLPEWGLAWIFPCNGLLLPSK